MCCQPLQANDDRRWQPQCVVGKLYLFLAGHILQCLGSHSVTLASVCSLYVVCTLDPSSRFVIGTHSTTQRACHTVVNAYTVFYYEYMPKIGQFSSSDFVCLSKETLKAVGPFYLVYMSWEVKDPSQEVDVQPAVDSISHEPLQKRPRRSSVYFANYLAIGYD